MKAEAGFRLAINKTLLEQSGSVHVDYSTGPFRRGFHVKASTQQEGCTPKPGGCSCG